MEHSLTAWARRISDRFTSNRATEIKQAIDGSDPCRYRLDSATSYTVSLPDGRKLGYAEYGSVTGRPIIYFHGLPGSRLEAASLHQIAVELEARIIAVDRPGIGWSSPHPARTLLSHANDIKYLTDHLELHSYGLLGISGGGPYVLACAIVLPQNKLKAATIVCGLGPPDMPKTGMSWQNWFGFAILYRYWPSFVKWWFRRQIITQLHTPDEKRLEMLLYQAHKSKLHPKDVNIFQDPHRMRLLLRSSRESFAQGLDPLVQDGSLLSTDFGFRIEDIRSDLPVQLWYGKSDTSVPPCHGEQTTSRLGGNATLMLEDETHASIGVDKAPEYLAKLVEFL